MAAGVSTIVAMKRAGLYRARVCAVRSMEAVRVVAAAIVGAAVFAVCQWLAGSLSAARPIQGAAIAAVALVVLRWRFSRWLKVKRSAGQYLRTVVLVGTNDNAVAVWRMLEDEPELGYRVGAVAGDIRHDVPWQCLPTSSDLAELGALAAQVGANGVIIVDGGLGATTTSAAVNEALAAGLHVQVWPGLVGLSTRRMRMSPVLGVPVFYVEPRHSSSWQEIVKRLMDVTLTVMVLPLVAPVLVVSALLIKLEDGGPAIYRHRVVGRFGAPVTVLKLRTMVPNASKMLGHVEALNERTGGPLFKASYDPRVTKIGRFLRASSIDELPQLWNVLTGTMSLVGPRFALAHEAEQFDEELRRRQQMRPGMTGLWQSEARDNPSFSAYRRLDLFYIENWSLFLDAAILVNTLHSVIVRALQAVRSAVDRKSTPPAQAGTEVALQEK
jgi:exopolysaccharide biosynthesis polyprenyl glycosylphosphotransferase